MMIGQAQAYTVPAVTKKVKHGIFRYFWSNKSSYWKRQVTVNVTLITLTAINSQ